MVLNQQLPVLSIPSTKLIYLSGGTPRVLAENSPTNIYLIQIRDEKDLKVFQTRELCVIAWNEHLPLPFTIPILPGCKIVRQGNGYLIMLSEDRIFTMQFSDNCPIDIHGQFARALDEFTLANQPVEKIALKNQMTYIYSDQENDDYLIEMSKKVGNFLDKNSIVVAGAISKGADYIGRGIIAGKDKIIEKTERGEEVEVDESWRTGLHYAAVATGTTAKVTRTILDGAASLVLKAGRYAGEKISASQETSSPEMKAAGEFLLKTGKAASVVVEGIIEGADSIAENISVSAAQIANHKYGSQAGEAAGSGLNAALNAYRTVTNVSSVTNPIRLATHAGVQSVNEKAAETSSQEQTPPPPFQERQPSNSVTHIFPHPDKYNPYDTLDPPPYDG